MARAVRPAAVSKIALSRWFGLSLGLVTRPLRNFHNIYFEMQIIVGNPTYMFFLIAINAGLKLKLSSEIYVLLLLIDCNTNTREIADCISADNRKRRWSFLGALNTWSTANRNQVVSRTWNATTEYHWVNHRQWQTANCHSAQEANALSCTFFPHW